MFCLTHLRPQNFFLKMVYKYANKKFTFNVFISKLDFGDWFVFIAVLFLAVLSLFLVYQYQNLAGDYNNIAGQNKALSNEIDALHEYSEVNERYSDILNEVDIAADKNDIEGVKKAIYVVYENIGNVTVKVLANVMENSSKIREDIRNLPYKNNLNQIKIKSMEVNEIITKNGTNETFGVGGRYFPNLRSIEMYQYYSEGLFHEDCHHAHFDKVSWDDWKLSETLYKESAEQDFVSEYAKTDFIEDFAETCEHILTNKTIGNSTILQKKVELVKKYV